MCVTRANAVEESPRVEEGVKKGLVSIEWMKMNGVKRIERVAIEVVEMKQMEGVGIKGGMEGVETNGATRWRARQPDRSPRHARALCAA